MRTGREVELDLRAAVAAAAQRLVLDLDDARDLLERCHARLHQCDAVVDPAGAKATPPIALCELQGYAYDAKRRMADVFDALGVGERAATLRRQAEQLRPAAKLVITQDPAGASIQGAWRLANVIARSG